MRLICKTCLGEYDDTLTDGMRYFHACAPVLYVRAKRGGNFLDVQPVNLKPADVVTVNRAGATIEVSHSARLPDDVLLFTRYGDRPGHRNENVIGSAAAIEAILSAGGKPPADFDAKVAVLQSMPIAAADDKSDVVAVPAPVDVPVDPTPVVHP